MDLYVIMCIYLFLLVGCDSAQNPSKIGSYQLGGLQRTGTVIPGLTHGINPRAGFWRKLLVEDSNRVENISKEDNDRNQIEDNTKTEEQMTEVEEKQEGKHEPAPILQKEETKQNESKSEAVDFQRKPEMKNDGVDKNLESRIGPENGGEEATMLQETDKEKVEEDVRKLGEFNKWKAGEESKNLGQNGTNQSKEIETQVQKQAGNEADVRLQEPQQKLNDPRNDSEAKKLEPLLEEATAKHPGNGKIVEEKKDQQQNVPRTDLVEVLKEKANWIKTEEEKGKGNTLEAVNRDERNEGVFGDTQNVKLNDVKEQDSIASEKGKEEEVQRQSIEREVEMPGDEKQSNFKEGELQSEFKEEEPKAQIKLEGSDVTGHDIDEKQSNSKMEELKREFKQEEPKSEIKLKASDTIGHDTNEKQSNSKMEELQSEFKEEEPKAEIKLEGSDITGHDINEQNELVVENKTVNKRSTEDVTEEKNESHGDDIEKVDASTETIGLQQIETESTAKENLESKEEAQAATNEAAMQLEELKQGSAIDPTDLGKPERDPSDDDYSDLMQELADLPSKFQETAGKVADHLRPDVLRWTDTSKVYFNFANQQITESFSPLVGKQYAPFLASMISYALLLLPLIVVLKVFEHIKAILSLQKILLFVNIYLAAYFATLVLASFAIGIEPMSFFYKNSPSNFLYLQLLQALGYVIYLLLQTANIINSCTSDTIVGKLAATIQWIGAILVGLHYYVTVFHPAVILKPPRTNGKFYAIYSVAFFILCLFARVKWVKKQYISTGDQVTNKKN